MVNSNQFDHLKHFFIMLLTNVQLS